MSDCTLQMRVTLTDELGNVVHDSSIPLQFLDSEISAAERADADAIKASAAYGSVSRLDMQNLRRRTGKGRVVNEISRAAGYMIGKRIETAIRCHFKMGM